MTSASSVYKTDNVISAAVSLSDGSAIRLKTRIFFRCRIVLNRLDDVVIGPISNNPNMIRHSTGNTVLGKCENNQPTCFWLVEVRFYPPFIFVYFCGLGDSEN